MSRYTGPKLKLMRAVGMNLPGLSRKTIERRPYPPGPHGGNTRRKKSEYGKQILEKQKLRFNYGITERYLRKLVHRSFRSKEHSGHKLLELLEKRLDSVVFRAGLAPTIIAARQLVSHGHVKVNGKKVDIASYEVKPGQVISLTEKGHKVPCVINSLENISLARPAWLVFEETEKSAKMITTPDRDSFPFLIELQLVVEFYARRVS